MAQTKAVPDRRTQHAEEAFETVAPAVGESQVTQQHVEEQRGPHLPEDRVFVVAKEIAQLQRLFDLLEKRLDRPAAFV